jgi:P27 family predicted phage terminase small subunit
MEGTASRRAERSWTRPVTQLIEGIEGTDEPPYEMIDKAAELWAEYKAHLESMKIWNAGDRRLLAALCEATATAELCTVMIHRYGLVVKGSRGNMVASKFIAIRRDAWQMQYRLSVEFGLTPASRTRIEVDPAYRPSTGGGPNPFA